MQEAQSLTFRTVGGRSFTGTVKNPSASVGSVASRLAARAGLAGTFELVDNKGLTLDPSTRLEDLPDSEITLASELTPA